MSDPTRRPAPDGSPRDLNAPTHAVDGLSGPVVLLVRLREGLVNHDQWLVHIVMVPTDDADLSLPQALCGLTFARDTTELLQDPIGVPCAHCLARAPVPGIDDQPRQPGEGR